MHRITVESIVLAIALLLSASWTDSAIAASEILAPWNSENVRTQLLASLQDQQLLADVRQRIDQVWKDVDSSASTDRLFGTLIQSIALTDAELMELFRECNSPPTGPIKSKIEILNRPARQAFIRANLSLFYGRYLVEQRLYDEAWDLLKSVDAREVVDPASLFFFQAVAAQGMLEIKPALDAIDLLLTRIERVPVRYSAIATLMQADLKSLEEKSLGEIARLMADSERRLDLGRAGEKVQGVQERIVSTLDEIIKKIEQQQGGGGGSEGGNGNQSGGSNDDSRVKGEEAPGETDKKRFDDKGRWGNLPEKDQAKAKNDLNKNFPSHYEQAIEKYTKRLAERAAKKK